MRRAKMIPALMAFVLMSFCVVEVAFARSQGLTTTVVITVKAKPQANLLPDDKNAGMVKELAKDQSMRQPYIKEQMPDVKSSGEKIYTITDRL